MAFMYQVALNSLRQKKRSRFIRRSHSGFVVKPKTTNYGISISIFKEGASLADYQAAVAIAFEEWFDPRWDLIRDGISVLRDRWASWCDFITYPSQCRGWRQAHDHGTRRREKSRSIARHHHRTPLELIQLGNWNNLMLKSKGIKLIQCQKRADRLFARKLEYQYWRWFYRCNGWLQRWLQTSSSRCDSRITSIYQWNRSDYSR